MAASDLVLALYDPTVAGHRIAAPGKLYEAFMLGRPVVVNRGTSLEGMVEGDRAGYVIDYDLNDALRRCLLLAAGERFTRLPELGRNARAAFERKYNWNICKARLDALVDRAAGTPGG
jgi:glycosyltransferase involved in cell wall biosynthesis